MQCILVDRPYSHMCNLFQNTFKSQGQAIDQNALHLRKLYFFSSENIKIFLFVLCEERSTTSGGHAWLGKAGRHLENENYNC